MRVLFSATAGDGHFYPLLPLAEAMRARGHDVAFAMSEEYAERIESAGFSASRPVSTRPSSPPD
ncbi:MAG: hypothetical protein NVSMB13_01650 [Mycobacteriales bacterium]